MIKAYATNIDNARSRRSASGCELFSSRRDMLMVELHEAHCSQNLEIFVRLRSNSTRSIFTYAVYAFGNI